MVGAQGVAVRGKTNTSRGRQKWRGESLHSLPIRAQHFRALARSVSG